MAKSQQQLGGDASKKCKVLEQLRSQLDMLLQKCKEVVEEETNSSSLEDEHIRRMSDFIIAFRKWNAPPLSGEFRKCLAGTEGYDRSTQSQILENSIDIVDKMDELLRNVDELTEKLKIKQGQCDSESTVRYPAYNCKQLPGPSGCTYWSCRTSRNVIDDGKTAFMILEDVN